MLVTLQNLPLKYANFSHMGCGALIVIRQHGGLGSTGLNHWVHMVLQNGLVVFGSDLPIKHKYWAYREYHDIAVQMITDLLLHSEHATVQVAVLGKVHKQSI